MANLSIGTKSDGSAGVLNFGGTDVVTVDASGISQGAGRRLAQIVEYKTGAVATGTTIIPYDDTIPQQTEGDQYLAATITPQSAASTLEVTVCVQGSNTAAAFWMIAALFRDAGADAVAVGRSISTTANGEGTVQFHCLVTSGSTSASTFKVRAGSSVAGTTTINGGTGARLFGGVLFSSITIKEYLP